LGTQQARERTCFLTTALLGLGEEDSRGFRALVAHRSSDYKLLERRGLIYRSMTCIPERCQYRHSHGPVPTGDCKREGWLLTLRGRLVIEFLRSGVAFDSAVQLASYHERDYTATTIIHRQVKSGAASVIFAADFPAMRSHKRGLKNSETLKSAAERAFAGQLARLTHLEKLLGDEVSSIQAIRSEMASTRHQMRTRQSHD
jgi:hypothetical protein